MGSSEVAIFHESESGGTAVKVFSRSPPGPSTPFDLAFFEEIRSSLVKMRPCISPDWSALGPALGPPSRNGCRLLVFTGDLASPSDIATDTGPLWEPAALKFDGASALAVVNLRADNDNISEKTIRTSAGSARLPMTLISGGGMLPKISSWAAAAN